MQVFPGPALSLWLPYMARLFFSNSLLYLLVFPVLHILYYMYYICIFCWKPEIQKGPFKGPLYLFFFF